MYSETSSTGRGGKLGAPPATRDVLGERPARRTAADAAKAAGAAGAGGTGFDIIV